MKARDEMRRRLFPHGRPSGLSRALDRLAGSVYAAGVRPQRLVTLEVRGRRTGRPISRPLVMVEVDGSRYLVSMLGENADWVRNVRAAQGRAVLRHGHREDVRLEDVAPQNRPPILRRFAECAPGARPHLPFDRDAHLDDIARVAADVPVFRVSACAPLHPAS